MKRILSLVFVISLTVIFVRGLVEEISLHLNYNYTIAHLTKIYRGAKLENLVNYWYIVRGERHERTAEWNEKSITGKRYLVKYSVTFPRGSKLFQEIEIPDSIKIDSGYKWNDFITSTKL